jgi:hypothetical protein
MIEIQCRGADLLPLDAIEEFQGNLKSRSKDDIQKIIKSIKNYGFSFPFFIWNGDGHNRCMDGHGRIQALAEMRRQGENLPLFPVVYVDAKDEAEARQKLLRLNSQYGKMTVDSVLEFTGGMSVEWGELKLPGGDILSIEDKENNQLDNEYTKKIEAPIYKPTGEDVSLPECVDTSKTNSLIVEIEASSLQEHEKSFLKLAAQRHTVFNYHNIAEIYANANEEMQDLMEKSALVIIDFEKAIEYGYVKLSEEIADQYLQDTKNA